MKTFRFAARALVLAGALAAFGCGPPPPEPAIQSSAPQSGYASRYPQELSASAAAFNDAEAMAQRTDADIPGYPAKLKKPKWAPVLQVVEEADAAGRSYDYVERIRRADGAAAFFEDRNEEITKKVAGAAQYAAKQKGCEVDVAGPAAHALKESVKEQLERYVRDRNEAHRTIERHREALGKENAAELEKQADSISYASYLVHIAMVEEKLRMRRLIEEMESVKASTDQAIAAERAFQGEPGRTDAEKKASQERVEELNKAKGTLESAAEQARNASENLEDRIAAAQKRHTESMDKIKADIRQRGNLPAAPAAEE
jgi:hypothetical protein